MPERSPILAPPPPADSSATATSGLASGAATIPRQEGLAFLYLASVTLATREMARFFRQRNRVIGALLQPIIFWVLFSAGLTGSFQPSAANPDLSYREFFFPGVLVMITLFTAIFATISIIEDRKEGFLQGVLVAPASRTAIVLGKVLGGTTLAMIQAWIFLLLAPLAGVPLSIKTVAMVSGALFLVGFGLTALGTVIAWRMDSTQGYHAIMSVVLFPMWLLSGAFFPAEGAAGWLRWVIALNPLTYGVALVRRVFYPLGPGAPAMPGPGPPAALVVTLLFGAAMFALAVRLARQETRR